MQVGSQWRQIVVGCKNVSVFNILVIFLIWWVQGLYFADFVLFSYSCEILKTFKIHEHCDQVKIL